MRLENIDIINFKNIAEASLLLSPGLNCFLGLNGMGKSNMLEAVHFLCLARGLSSMPESQMIRHGEKLLSVKGTFLMESGSSETVSAGIIAGKGKKVKRNGKEYDRISAHIGAFPLVTVTPADSLLVSGAAEGRRRLMDMVISQADASYLSHLIRYNRSLDSRNRMLRAGVNDDLLYESVEASMQEAAAAIHDARSRWVADIAPDLARYYAEIADNGETASLGYRSSLNSTTMSELFRMTRPKDRVLGFTSQGVHRDDLEMGLGRYSMRRLGSQGQVKSYTVALRFAIFDFLKRSSGITPLLLLDDIFDKLDATRVERIMHMVSRDHDFSQIFITDTTRSHLDDILRHIDGPARLFAVDNGCFSLLEEEQKS